MKLAVSTVGHHEPVSHDPVALFAAHRLSLVRLAVLLVDDLASAEDVVQDAFAGFVARRRPLDDPATARWPTCAPRSSTTPARPAPAPHVRGYVAPRESSRTARTGG